MSLETNKALARRFREEMYNTGNVAIASEICDCDYVQHPLDPLTPDFGNGPEAVRQTVLMYHNTFPDARCTIEDIIVQGDRGKVGRDQALLDGLLTLIREVVFEPITLFVVQIRKRRLRPALGRTNQGQAGGL